MRTNITIGAILLAFSLRGYFCAISERFFEVQNAKGKEATMTVMKEVLTTAEDCAVLCMFAKTCLSFFHDKADGTCRLVTGTILESQMTPVPSRPQMSYFISNSTPDNLLGSFCPDDFDKTSIPGVCFKLIDTPLRNNNAARTYCESLSTGSMVGHLLRVYTMEMVAKLVTMVSIFPASDKYHFDGYKRLPDETWVDWKGDELAFVNWHGTQPDNENNPDPRWQQCIFMSSNGKVADIGCSRHRGKVFCQLEYVKKM